MDKEKLINGQVLMKKVDASEKIMQFIKKLENAPRKTVINDASYNQNYAEWAAFIENALLVKDELLVKVIEMNGDFNKKFDEL